MLWRWRAHEAELKLSPTDDLTGSASSVGRRFIGASCARYGLAAAQQDFGVSSVERVALPSCALSTASDEAEVAYPILDKWLFLRELCRAFVKGDRTEISPFVYAYD